MKPITELRLGMMNQDDVARVQGYLERRLHCTMTYMGGGFYLVHFPDRTTEEEYTELDPQYREEKVIRLPNGVILKKIINYPCMRPEEAPF